MLLSLILRKYTSLFPYLSSESGRCGAGKSTKGCTGVRMMDWGLMRQGMTPLLREIHVR